MYRCRLLSLGLSVMRNLRGPYETIEGFDIATVDGVVEGGL